MTGQAVARLAKRRLQNARRNAPASTLPGTFVAHTAFADRRASARKSKGNLDEEAIPWRLRCRNAAWTSQCGAACAHDNLGRQRLAEGAAPLRSARPMLGGELAKSAAGKLQLRAAAGAARAHAHRQTACGPDEGIRPSQGKYSNLAGTNGTHPALPFRRQ